MHYIYHYLSPLGGMTMAGNDVALTGLWFDGQKYFGSTLPMQYEEKYEDKELSVFAETKRWLDLYFQGKIPDFTPPLQWDTTPFRRAVWEILLTIPYGQTVEYGDIARRIAKQKGISAMSAQAVGGAVGHNPISLIVPCHRVVGREGSLTGYAAGVDKKELLLTMEKNGRGIF